MKTLYILRAEFGNYDANWHQNIFSSFEKSTVEELLKILNPTYKKISHLIYKIKALKSSDEIFNLSDEDMDYYLHSLYLLEEKLKMFEDFYNLSITALEIEHFNPLVI